MSLARFLMLMQGLLTASASPSSRSASISGAGTATTGSTTVTPVGGSGAFSYAWLAPSFTATSPTSATTTFSRALSSGESFSGTATCTVTDVQNGQTVPVDVPVSFASVGPPAFSATIAPTSQQPGAGQSPGNTAQGTFTATPHDGVGPYTYSWSSLGPYASTIIGSSTDPSCLFRFTVTDQDGSAFSVQCVVTDTGGGGATSSPTALMLTDN